MTDDHGPDNPPLAAPSEWIPARDDAAQGTATDRAAITLRALEGVGIDVAGKRLVDLGAGYGTLSVACALKGADVLSVDADADRLARIGARASAAGVAVSVRQANLLDTWSGPADADLTFLIGVAEYAGLWRSDQRPDVLQRQLLVTAYQTLAPGGVLVFASKNRIWPRYLFRDFHTKLWFVNALPRPVADAISRRSRGVDFRHHIHSSSGWSRLVASAGFTSVDAYVPYFSYQYPLLLTDHPRLDDARSLRELGSGPEAERYQGKIPGWMKASMIGLAGEAGLKVAPHVVIVACK